MTEDLLITIAYGPNPSRGHLNRSGKAGEDAQSAGEGALADAPYGKDDAREVGLGVDAEVLSRIAAVMDRARREALGTSPRAD